jgi:hypothetical protein
MDVIFASGNGLARVDDEWFQYAGDTSLYGVPVLVVPAEELLWSKAFVLERERYDGADVAHLLRHQAKYMDWERLERRFGAHRAVLDSHLTLFQYIYSDARDHLPGHVLERFAGAAGAPRPAGEPARVCRGTLLSRQQFLPDLDEDGYADGRLIDRAMTPADIRRWTDAIEEPGPPEMPDDQRVEDLAR